MNAQPTAWGEAETAALRARLQQQQTVPTHQYDFVVVGGGVAGMCAATAAARLGCRVALVNDRLYWVVITRRRYVYTWVVSSKRGPTRG